MSIVRITHAIVRLNDFLNKIYSIIEVNADGSVK